MLVLGKIGWYKYLPAQNLKVNSRFDAWCGSYENGFY